MIILLVLVATVVVLVALIIQRDRRLNVKVFGANVQFEARGETRAAKRDSLRLAPRREPEDR